MTLAAAASRVGRPSASSSDSGGASPPAFRSRSSAPYVVAEVPRSISDRVRLGRERRRDRVRPEHRLRAAPRRDERHAVAEHERDDSLRRRPPDVISEHPGVARVPRADERVPFPPRDAHRLLRHERPDEVAARVLPVHPHDRAALLLDPRRRRRALAQPAEHPLQPVEPVRRPPAKLRLDEHVGQHRRLRARRARRGQRALHRVADIADGSLHLDLHNGFHQKGTNALTAAITAVLKSSNGGDYRVRAPWRRALRGKFGSHRVTSPALCFLLEV